MKHTTFRKIARKNPAALHAERLGWDISVTKKGHLKFSKAGATTVFTSGTPSDCRTHKNAIKEINRRERESLV